MQPAPGDPPPTSSLGQEIVRSARRRGITHLVQADFRVDGGAVLVRLGTGTPCGLPAAHDGAGDKELQVAGRGGNRWRPHAPAIGSGPCKNGAGAPDNRRIDHLAVETDGTAI